MGGNPGWPNGVPCSPDRHAGLAAALVLADGRFPAGGHAHSGGVEEGVLQGLIDDLDSLRYFLAGRLATVGLVSAGLGAGACAICLGPVGGRVGSEPSGQALDNLSRLDREADARMPSSAQRLVSRRQGRQLLRTALEPWPGGILAAVAAVQPEPHLPLAMGGAAAAAGLLPGQAAVCVAYGAVAGPAWAAVRLLGLDPLAVAALVADLAYRVDQVAAEAAACVPEPGEELAAWAWMGRLPAASAPLLDHLAESHAVRKMRLFAS